MCLNNARMIRKSLSNYNAEGLHSSNLCVYISLARIINLSNLLMKNGFLFLICCCCMTALAQEDEVKTLEHPMDVEPVEIIGLNSPYRETNLSITPDGNMLYFMSGRGGQSWSKQDGYTGLDGKPEFDGDIWFSVREDGAWLAPSCVQGVNTSQGEDEPNISPGGQLVAFQSWQSKWRTNGGPYYMARLDGDKWMKAKGLGGGINKFFKDTGFATDGMALSADGRLFLVAAGRDYAGVMNIYASRKGKSGEWSDLKKIALNTGSDERSVFLAADSKTLYFASKGYGGFGGLDIFKTTLNDDGTFGEIFNIGAPFNTSNDDYGFITTASGEEAYFVRNGDIYFADLKNADPEIKPTPTMLIKGTVSTPSGEKLGGALRLRDKKSKKIIATSRSNSISGEYAFSIPNVEGSYELEFKNDSYDLFKQDVSFSGSDKFEEVRTNLTIPDNLKHPEEIKEEIPEVASSDEPATKSEPEAVTQSETKTEDASGATPNEGVARGAVDEPPFIFLFDSGSAKIKEQYKSVLADLARFQKMNLNIVLELNGHTDSIGTNPFNDNLSQRRVDEIYNFLLIHNAWPGRIVRQYFGEVMPAAENDFRAGRELNRRVVLRIIQNLKY